jgi:hypothetical protein
MRRLIKVLSLTALSGLISTSAFSQLSVSYYSSNLSKIGLAYNTTNRFWTEVRLYSNTEIYDITPELVFCYNVVNKEQHNVYMGLGGIINYFTGFVMPVGVQFTPFEKLDRFSLHIELEPVLDLNHESIIIQSSWGLRYKFIKKQ